MTRDRGSARHARIQALHEAARRQRDGVAFQGVIFAHQLQVTIGQCVKDLELIAAAGDPEDLANQVCFLPLR